MAFSIQRAVSDGSMTLLPISIEYFDREEISVLFDGVLNARQWAWVGTTDKTLSFTPAVANTVEVMIVRSTDLAELRHQFSLGAQFTAESLDESLLQILHIAQEAKEGSNLGEIFQNLNFHGFKAINMGNGSDPGDAVNHAQMEVHDATVVGYMDTTEGYKNAAAASAAAALASENAAEAAKDALFNDLASTVAGKGSELVAFKQAGVGAVARTISSKLLETVSVADFSGADSTGVSSSVAGFNAAAAAGRLVKVPAGIYLIDSPTLSAYWMLEPGAVITGLPALNDSQAPTANIDNTSRLTGRIFRHQNTDSGAGVLVGDPDPWMEQYIRPSSLSRAELSVVSPNGHIAITGASKTSDNPPSVGTDMACIGGNFYAINDREQQAGEVLTAYAIYAEARRRPSGGAAYGMEIDIANQDAAVHCTPNSTLGYAEYNGGLIVNSGAGLSSASLFPASFGVLFGNNGGKFLRGIVFNDNCLDSSTLEAISMPLSYKLAWYEGGNSVSHLDHREHLRKISTDTASIGVEDNHIRARASYANSASLDAIYKSTSYGWFNGSAYQGAFTRVIQRTNYSANTARFSFDIDAKNSNGTSAQVSLNGTADNTFSPGSSDNVLLLGGPSFRWSVVYSGTGTINTSDAREKQQIRNLSDAERSVAVRLKGLVRAFKFNDAVAKKGGDARIHFGVIAQDVKAAFEAEGLVAENYAILCYDEWDETPEERDNDGNVIHGYVPAGSRYGVRYEELLAFIIASL